MNCHQCGKPVSKSCTRTDCLAEITLAVRERAIQRKTAEERTLNLARHHFRDNFDKVAAWSEAKGWTKPEQRGTNFRAASETDRGKLVIQAIARSL